jgi:hypothetical protein
MGREIYAAEMDWLDTLGMEPDENLANWAEEETSCDMSVQCLSEPVILDLEELMPN